MICDIGDLGPEHQREFDDRMDEFCTRSLRAGLATAIALNWLLQFPPSVSLSAFLPRRTEEPYSPITSSS